MPLKDKYGQASRSPGIKSSNSLSTYKDTLGKGKLSAHQCFTLWTWLVFLASLLIHTHPQTYTHNPPLPKSWASPNMPT